MGTVVMWKAASKLPLTIYTGPAAFKTRLSLRSAGTGALDVQKDTSFTSLHGASPSLSGRAAVGDRWTRALEALEIIEDRQWRQGYV